MTVVADGFKSQGGYMILFANKVIKMACILHKTSDAFIQLSRSKLNSVKILSLINR